MPTKRTNGEGTIRQRKNGTWEGRYSVLDDSGKKVQRSVYGKTKIEVSKKLNSACHDLNEGTYLAPDKMTVKQWFDTWQEDYLPEVKQSTRSTYAYNIRQHIIPRLGRIELQKLTSPMIQQFYKDIMQDHEKTRKDGTKKTVPGLSAKTVKNIHGVLNEGLNQAVLCRYIRYNPASACKLPRIEKKEISVIEGADVSVFLKEIEGKMFDDLFKVALFTGLRRSELLGLQWQDINFEKGLIHVDRQLKCERSIDGHTNRVVFDTLKNGKSRTIYPASEVFNVLKQVRAKQAENKLKYGSSFDNKDNLVFTNEIGEHLSHSTVYHQLKDRATAIGMPSLRLHDLRHTFATLSIMNGDDIKTVSENLGHATVAFTLDIYGHCTDEMKKKSADRMQAFIEQIGG